MTDATLAQRIISCDVTRAIYQGCLATEFAKVTPEKLKRPERDYSPERVEARAWAQTKAVMSALEARAA